MILNTQCEASPKAAPREAGLAALPAIPEAPLVVDLDGTLLKTDLLVESLFALMTQAPLYLFAVPFWLLKGLAYLKQQISRRITLDPARLPYNEDFLVFLKRQRAYGRRLILATGTDERLARRISEHLHLFSDVLASDGRTNLCGRQKRDRLITAFGEGQFDYAGNARSDVIVWSAARAAILVNASDSLTRNAARLVNIARVFARPADGPRALVRALRLHHWLKNLLVFVPFALTHQFGSSGGLEAAALAFLAFGLCASGIYLMNDLMDLAADRLHPRKRLRPLAAGDLPLAWALAAIPLLVGGSLILSRALPPYFLRILMLYLALNIAYSMYVKRIVLLDAVMLAGFYTMRIMAGCAALNIWPSSWLLALSTFLFLSLALLKRYDELVTLHAAGERVSIRGYQMRDKELLATLGTCSGYAAVLVLVIYLATGAAEIHYTHHHLIWLVCVILLYWISYLWLIAHRNEMPDDPLVFAVTNRVSRTLIMAGVLIALLGV